jgi:hypothetical protein
MNMRIEPLGDGKYKLSYEGRSLNPAIPYTAWWSCLRQEANGCNWEYRLTKQEVLQRLEKEL